MIGTIILIYSLFARAQTWSNSKQEWPGGLTLLRTLEVLFLRKKRERTKFSCLDTNLTSIPLSEPIVACDIAGVTTGPRLMRRGCDLSCAHSPTEETQWVNSTISIWKPCPNFSYTSWLGRCRGARELESGFWAETVEEDLIKSVLDVRPKYELSKSKEITRWGTTCSIFWDFSVLNQEGVWSLGVSSALCLTAPKRAAVHCELVKGSYPILFHSLNWLGDAGWGQNKIIGAMKVFHLLAVSHGAGQTKRRQTCTVILQICCRNNISPTSTRKTAHHSSLLRVLESHLKWFLVIKHFIAPVRALRWSDQISYR